MKIVSTCPHCGAPIYAEEVPHTSTVVPFGPPKIHYTCECRYIRTYLNENQD